MHMSVPAYVVARNLGSGKSDMKVAEFHVDIRSVWACNPQVASSVKINTGGRGFIV